VTTGPESTIAESSSVFTLLEDRTDPRRTQLGIQCEGCGWSQFTTPSLADTLLRHGIDHHCPLKDPWGARMARPEPELVLG
jgi:hypothetical protein